MAVSRRSSVREHRLALADGVCDMIECWPRRGGDGHGFSRWIGEEEKKGKGDFGLTDFGFQPATQKSISPKRAILQ